LYLQKIPTGFSFSRHTKWYSSNARRDENTAPLGHALQLRAAFLSSLLHFFTAATGWKRTALLSPWNNRTLTLGAHLQALKY
jgi:hypothetical protein